MHYKSLANVRMHCNAFKIPLKCILTQISLSPVFSKAVTIYLIGIKERMDIQLGRVVTLEFLPCLQRSSAVFCQIVAQVSTLQNQLLLDKASP